MPADKPISPAELERAPQSVIDHAIERLEDWANGPDRSDKVKDLRHAIGVLRNLDAVSRRPAPPAGEGMREALEELRIAGWRVAVHNDYRLNGTDHTFWLLTHPSGIYIKGEGQTDAEALAEVRAALSRQGSGEKE